MTRQAIINEVARHIDFFREKWTEFCEWVEECGKQLRQRQAEQTDEYYRTVETYCQTHKALVDARERNDADAIMLFDNECRKVDQTYERAKAEYEQRAQTLAGQRWVPWSDHGMIIPRYTATMLDLPCRGTFYAPPDIVNPILWFLGDENWRDVNALETVRGRDLPLFSAGRNPRGIKDEERLLCDCALLTTLHDSQVPPREPHIRSSGAYQEQYFKCDDFWRHLQGKLSAMDERGELQRAWDRVKVDLERRRRTLGGKPMSAPKDGVAQTVIIQNSTVGDIHQGQNLAAGNHSRVGKETPVAIVASWLWRHVKVVFRRVFRLG